MIEEVPCGLRSGNVANVVVDARICINFQGNVVIGCPLPKFRNAPDEPIRSNDEITNSDVADKQACSTARAEMHTVHVAIMWQHKNCISV